MYRILRSDDLCLGHKHGPAGCPDASDVTCSDCGAVRTVADTNAPGQCACGSWVCTVNRCSHCPLISLAEVRADSPAGRLLEKVLHLRGASKHVQISWSEVSAEVVQGLQIFEEEVQKFVSEPREQDAIPG